MVASRWITLFFFCAFLPFRLLSQEVAVTAEVEDKAVVGMPIKGTITVTHDRGARINADTFKLGGAPIHVDFVKDVQMSQHSPLLVSVYKFTIEPQKAGLHVLPEVSINVGGKEYRSIQSTYEVESGTKKAEPLSKTKQSTGESSIILRLENIIEGETTLYPGQRTKVGYRFIFNYSLDLTKEQLPFLVATGSRKIGEKESKEYSQTNLNYVDVTQVIEAHDPGEYTFPPGTIEGRAYRPGPGGQKDYAKNVSQAESQPVTITVIPFPDKGKPSSFNGAIGESLDIEMSLLSSSEVAVGDKIVLLIKIGGTGELASLPMPEICCQPGFSGFFRLSDLPPVEEINGNIKTFKVETRPLTTSIKEVPILEFSYFNPKDKSYTTLHTRPIPLKVVPIKAKPEEEKKPGLAQPKEEAPEEFLSPEGIEIEGNYPLSASDLNQLPFGTWWVLIIIPLGMGALFLQLNMRAFIEKQRQTVKVETSSDLFWAALRHDPGSSPFCNGLQRAFLLRLVERGEIGSIDVPPEKLPDTDAGNKVKALLREIEEKRFSGKEHAFDDPFIEKAKKLFEEI